MMQIHARITTAHSNAGCIAHALTPDNLNSMKTIAEVDHVITEISGTTLRSVIASVDDYLMNLVIADDACSSFSHVSEGTTGNGNRTFRGTRNGDKDRCNKKIQGGKSSR